MARFRPIVLPPKEATLGQGHPTLADMGSGYSVPGGIESIFEYNGLLLNDRSTVDRYRVREVEGLWDADVRDAREANPSDHGETDYESFYGGRTIAMRVRIEAHTLRKLRDMQQAFRTAFLDLQEKPLYIHSGTLARTVKIECKKSVALAGPESQTDYNFFREVLLTMRASQPEFRSLYNYTKNIQVNRISNPIFRTNTTGWSSVGGSTVFARVTGGWSSHGIASLRYQHSDAGGATIGVRTLSGTSGIPVTPGQTYTFQVDVNIVDNLTTGIRPSLLWYKADGTASTVLTASHGTYVTGTGEYRLIISGIAPSDAAFAGGRVAGAEASNLLEFNTDGAWFVGGAPTPPEASGLTIVPNEGNWPSKPVVVFHDGIQNLKMTNQANGNVIEFTEDIPDDETYTLDVSKGTLSDSDDVNHFDILTDDSYGPMIEPNDNPIEVDIETYGTSENSHVEIRFQNAWM
jgi:hypothetical protein